MAINGPYITETQVASSIPFDNSSNGFTATDTQAAIEEAKTSSGAGKTLIALFADTSGSISNKFLSTEVIYSSDSLPAVVPIACTVTKITYAGTSSTPTGAIEFRINTSSGTAALTVTLTGTQTQVFTVSLSLAAGDKLNCKVASGGSGISKPLVKVWA